MPSISAAEPGPAAREAQDRVARAEQRRRHDARHRRWRRRRSRARPAPSPGGTATQQPRSVGGDRGQRHGGGERERRIEEARPVALDAASHGVEQEIGRRHQHHGEHEPPRRADAGFVATPGAGQPRAARAGDGELERISGVARPICAPTNSGGNIGSNCQFAVVAAALLEHGRPVMRWRSRRRLGAKTRMAATSAAQGQGPMRRRRRVGTASTGDREAGGGERGRIFRHEREAGEDADGEPPERPVAQRSVPPPPTAWRPRTGSAAHPASPRRGRRSRAVSG